MKRWTPLLLLLSAPLAVAQSDETLRSPECLAALAALTQQEDAIIARRKAAAPNLPVQQSPLPELQRAAARACLGSGAALAPNPARRFPSPVALPGGFRPGDVPATATVPDARRAPVELAPVRQAPLVSVTGCDAQGCWASDGTRVQRLGPMLLGPRGYCTQVGAVLTCP